MQRSQLGPNSAQFVFNKLCEGAANPQNPPKLGDLGGECNVSATFQTTPKHGCQKSSLLGPHHQHWIARTQDYLEQLRPAQQQGLYPRILLSHTEPIELLAAFMAACIAECPVFLGNPHWSVGEWQQVLALAQPHHVWGTLPIPVQDVPLETANEGQKGWIMIPTGGSSGSIKFAIHTWATLTASVQGFQAFFERDVVNSCCVLPLYHVSGLLQFLRSLLTQGQLLVFPFCELVNGQSQHPDFTEFLSNESVSPQDFFLSLVPTQLQRLLQNPARIPWLQQFPVILLGGAPPWPTLLSATKTHRLNVAPTYGMTETAAQVATLKPHDFLKGDSSSGYPLPHCQIKILPTDGINRPSGQIKIQATSLFRGYYPHYDPMIAFTTDDLGYLDERGHLTLMGRNSRKILSGGENIYPEEIEAALYTTQLVQDVYVLGIPDEDWGEAVTALYVPANPTVTQAQLKTALASQLSRYKQPKKWVCVTQIPRNAQGKVNSAQLQIMGFEL